MTPAAGDARYRVNSSIDEQHVVGCTLWGALATLAVTGRGTEVLALGRNAAAFASVAEWFGSDVTCVDGDWRVAERGSDTLSVNDTAPGASIPLPYADGRFDTVFVSDALEWNPAEPGGTMAARLAREHVLRECRRVLRAGGILLLLVENRFGITTFGGKRHPATGVRFFDLIPRALYLTLPRRVRVRARASPSYSRRGWLRLLSRAGFTVEDWRSPWPSPREWSRVTSASRPPTQSVGGAEASLKERVADLILTAARALGLAHTIAPHYLLSARMIGSGGEADASKSLLSEIAAAEGEQVDDSVVLATFFASHSLCFTAGCTFFKVALDEVAAAKIERYAAATRILSRHPIARYVPLPIRLAETRGARYLACPAVRGDPALLASERDVGAILDALREGSALVRLSETEFWSRLFEPNMCRSIAALGGAAVLDHVERLLGERTVRAGIVHGDLHLENLLIEPGRISVIDWDYFDEHSPQFVDVIQAIGALRMGPQGQPRHTFVSQMRSILAADPGLPLRAYLFERDDALSIAEMVSCFLLWHVSIEPSGPGSSPSVLSEEIIRDWFARCEEWLGVCPPVGGLVPR